MKNIKIPLFFALISLQAACGFFTMLKYSNVHKFGTEFAIKCIPYVYSNNKAIKLYLGAIPPVAYTGKIPEVECRRAMKNFNPKNKLYLPSVKKINCELKADNGGYAQIASYGKEIKPHSIKLLPSVYKEKIGESQSPEITFKFPPYKYLFHPEKINIKKLKAHIGELRRQKYELYNKNRKAVKNYNPEDFDNPQFFGTAYIKILNGKAVISKLGLDGKSLEEIAGFASKGS